MSAVQSDVRALLLGKLAKSSLLSVPPEHTLRRIGETLLAAGYPPILPESVLEDVDDLGADFVREYAQVFDGASNEIAPYRTLFSALAATESPLRFADSLVLSLLGPPPAARFGAALDYLAREHAQRSGQESHAVLRWFRRILAAASKADLLDDLITPDLLLLSEAGRWKPASELAHPRTKTSDYDTPDVDPADLLAPDLAGLLPVPRATEAQGRLSDRSFQPLQTDEALAYWEAEWAQS